MQKAGGGKNLSFSKNKSEGWDWNSLRQKNPGNFQGKVNPAALASWLLYAYSSEGEGIRSPSAFAISQLRDKPNNFAPGIYAQLARLGHDELLARFEKYLQFGEAEKGAGWKKFAKGMKRARLIELAGRLFDITPEHFDYRIEYISADNPPSQLPEGESTEKSALVAASGIVPDVGIAVSVAGLLAQSAKKSSNDEEARRRTLLQGERK